MQHGTKAKHKPKRTIVLIVAIVVVCGGTVFWLLQSGGSGSQSSDSSASQQKSELDSKLERACTLFTENNAKTLLGSGAVHVTAGDEPADSYSDAIATSRCTYSDQDSSQTVAVEAQKFAILTARVPRTDAGKLANEQVFQSGSLPPGAEIVAGYGETAFWNPEFGQLNILANGEWYVLEYGSPLPQSRSLGDTLKFADIVKNNF